MANVMKPVARRGLGIVGKMCEMSGILGLKCDFQLQEDDTGYSHHHGLDHVEVRPPGRDREPLPSVSGPATHTGRLGKAHFTSG